MTVDSVLYTGRRATLHSAAIIGVGQSAYTRRPGSGQSTHTFIRDAVVAALADAGVDAGDVQGMAVASFSLAPDTAVAGYGRIAANYNIATRDHLAPLGHGGPNGVYALVASRQIKAFGLEKSDYGHIAIAQRAWAANNPFAVYRAPLSMDEYLAAPMVADPLSRYDCVPVVAGAQAIVLAHPDRAPGGRAVRVRAHRMSFNYD